MATVPRRQDPAPEGGCGGICPSLAVAHGEPDTVAGHDRFVRRLTAASAEPVVALLEALVFASGPLDERSTEPGVPHLRDLVEFVQAHQWAEPVLAARLAVAIADLGIDPQPVEPGELGVARNRAPARCRKRPPLD